MVERYANCFTLVLKYEHEFYKLERPQLPEPVGPNTHKFIDLLHRLLSERRSVVRAIQNYFADTLGRTNRIEVSTNNSGCVRNTAQTGKAIFKHYDVVLVFGNLGGETAGRGRTQRTMALGWQKCSVLSLGSS